MKCEMCGAREEHWPKNRGWERNLFGPEFSVCSAECCKSWFKARLLWLTIQNLKNMPTWPFEKFQEIFDFNLDGGYAREKYEQMCGSTLPFLCGLDKDNVIKLSKAIRI